jgi:lysophospholipase L1-like esterase
MRHRPRAHSVFVECLESRQLLSSSLFPALDRSFGHLPTLINSDSRVSGQDASTSGYRVASTAITASALVTSALVAPAASFLSSTTSQIQLTATTASGGSGNYTYQWHRATSAGFTPSASNILPGATGLSLTDTTGLVAGTPYFYVLEANDGTTSVFSNQVIGALSVPTTPIPLPYQGGPVVLAYIGSSTWAINQGSGQVPSLIDQDLRASHPGIALTTINGAVAGAKTSDFLPGTSLNNSVKAALQASTGYKVLRLMIGSNDAAAGVPAATWLANMQSIINDALTWPVDQIILEEIGLRLDGGNATLDLIRQYNAARSSLAGGKVVLGTAYSYEDESTHLNTLSSDNIHQTDAGQQILAANQATELGALFTPPFANGSFEATRVNGYAAQPSGTGWTFSGSTGIQANGSVWGAPAAPDGTQTAYLQTSGSIDQSFNVATAGTYQIAFKAAQRAYLSGTSTYQQIAVYLDGNLLNVCSPTSSSSWNSFSFTSTLTAGVHTLSFRTAVNTGDTTAFLDAVSITLQSAPPPPVTAPTFSNGSFETPQISSYAYRPSGTGWTFSGSSGIQANGSVWAAPTAPDGTQTAFLQTSGQIDQTFSVSSNGTYLITFNGARRAYLSGTSTYQQIAVYIDGTLINVFSPTSAASWNTFSLSPALAAGNHTLSFRAAVTTGDTTAFLDAVNVTLQSAPPPPVTAPAFTNGSFEAPQISGYAYEPSGTGWIFSGSTGIQANSSVWGAPNAPDGTQTAYLQTSGQIDQTFSVAAGGSYQIAFKGALRAYRSGTSTYQQIAVYLDGTLVNVFSPTSSTSWNSFSFSSTLANGNHTLSFRTAVSTGDTTAFLDNVTIS